MAYSFQLERTGKSEGGDPYENEFALTLTLMAIGGAQAQPPSGSAVPVTVENFVRAETDLHFGGFC
jgi:hypothetical protein